MRYTLTNKIKDTLSLIQKFNIPTTPPATAPTWDSAVKYETRINFESFSIKSFIKMSTLLHVITIVQVLPAHYSIGNRFDRHN